MADDNNDPKSNDLGATPNGGNDITDKKPEADKTIPVESYNIVADKYRKAKEELEALKAEQAENARKAQEEQGKYKELYEQAKAELDAKGKEILQVKKIDAIKTALRNSNAKNPDVAIKLLDLDKVALLEDGNVDLNTITSQVKTLQETDAYLFGSEPAPTIGNPSSGSPEGGTAGIKTFKRSQLADSAFYVQNEKDILEAMRTGNIIDDVSSKK